MGPLVKYMGADNSITPNDRLIYITAISVDMNTVCYSLHINTKVKLLHGTKKLYIVKNIVCTRTLVMISTSGLTHIGTNIKI